MTEKEGLQQLKAGVRIYIPAKRAMIKTKMVKEKVKGLLNQMIFPSTIPELEELAAFLERYVPKKEGNNGMS